MTQLWQGCSAQKLLFNHAQSVYAAHVAAALYELNMLYYHVAKLSRNLSTDDVSVYIDPFGVVYRVVATTNSNILRLFLVVVVVVVVVSLCEKLVTNTWRPLLLLCTQSERIASSDVDEIKF
uniref:Uncharacterized protein n=1 Tax=Glossina brevipalpis TaxID=37001 RepID=A0A1A9VZS7_9MUSC